MINKKDFGGHGDIEALVGQLSGATKGWPVPLSTPVTRPSGSSESAPWLHPDSVTREDAESLVSGGADGTYLVRQRTG